MTPEHTALVNQLYEMGLRLRLLDRLIREVEELRAVLRTVATFDPDNNNASDLFHIIAKARAALDKTEPAP